MDVDKRVYILGAGSSIGHSKGKFPSIEGFFRAARELNYQKGDEFIAIEKFVKKIWGRNILSKQNPINIEELFTHIEIELERSNSPLLLDLHQKFLKLIQKVLLSLENEISGQKGDFNTLVEVEHSRPVLRKDDTIITYNWDLLLDNILGRQRCLENPNASPTGNIFPQYDNFKVDLSAYSERTWAHLGIEPPYQTWKPKVGYFLKMHGSIDWFYCGNESCRALHKVFPQVDPTQQYLCSECHEPVKFLIIPPILNKAYRQYPLIRKIWNIATQEIRSANEIIIWGYSLPPTDFHSIWLLRQGREAPLQKITIINPEVVTKTKKNPNTNFINRFKNIFSDKIPQGSPILFENFSDFADGNDIKRKFGARIAR